MIDLLKINLDDQDLEVAKKRIKIYRGQSLGTYNLCMVNLVCLDHSFNQDIEYSSFVLRPVEAIAEFI